MFSTQFDLISSSKLMELVLLGNVSRRRVLFSEYKIISSSSFMPKPSSKRGFKQKFLVPVRARKLSRFRSECNICDSSCLRISFGIEISRSELSREFLDVNESESKLEFKSFSKRNSRSWCRLCKL